MKILIVVEKVLYDAIRLTAEFNTWLGDLKDEGYECSLFICYSFTTKEVIKTALFDQDGGIFVGRVPVCEFESKFNPIPLLTDMYYMDKDSLWVDSDGDGRLDTNEGEIRPEIFVSRIVFGNLSGRHEVESTISYFRKVNAYRRGELRQLPRALLYNDGSFRDKDHAIYRLYSETEVYDVDYKTLAYDFRDKLGFGNSFVEWFAHSYIRESEFVITVYSTGWIDDMSHDSGAIEGNDMLSGWACKVGTDLPNRMCYLVFPVKFKAGNYYFDVFLKKMGVAQSPHAITMVIIINGSASIFREINDNMLTNDFSPIRIEFNLPADAYVGIETHWIGNVDISQQALKFVEMPQSMVKYNYTDAMSGNPQFNFMFMNGCFTGRWIEYDWLAGHLLVSSTAMVVVAPSYADGMSDSNLGIFYTSLRSGKIFGEAFKDLLSAWLAVYTNRLTFHHTSFMLFGDPTLKLDHPVLPVPVPPILNPIGNKSVREGQSLSFTVTAGNADRITITGLPQGAIFDNNTFYWTPNFRQQGRYYVVFEAINANGTDSETIEIRVIDVKKRGG